MNNKEKLKEVKEALGKIQKQIAELEAAIDKDEKFELPYELQSYEEYTAWHNESVGEAYIGDAIYEMLYTKKTYARFKLQWIADKLNDGWTLDWDARRDNCKYYIAYCYRENRFEINWLSLLDLSVAYFKSEELAEKAIEIMDADLELLK